MNPIAHEFSVLPGVIGTCVSVLSKDMLFSSLPDYFTNGMVNDVSNNMGRMMQMASVKGLEPQTMAIRYDKFDIVAMQIESDAMLLVLCEVGSNTSLIATTACMLAPEIVKALQQQPEEKIANSTPPPNKTNSENSPQEWQVNTQTSQALDEIKQALLGTVGPVADLVFDECMERWTVSNPPDISRIFELIGCLSGEIDNSELFEEFKGKISTLL